MTQGGSNIRYHFPGLWLKYILAFTEIRKRHNEEVAKTNALVNQADDFEIATKIRAMTAAAEANGSASGEWIAWANVKAGM